MILKRALGLPDPQPLPLFLQAPLSFNPLLHHTPTRWKEHAYPEFSEAYLRRCLFYSLFLVWSYTGAIDVLKLALVI